MKNILITNDDGVDSGALKILRSALSGLGRPVIVAPATPMNAVSNTITLHKPVRMKELEESVFSVTGTPVDCARMGIINVLEDKADLLVSGINDGANLGDDVTYSGTVAAAREAAFLGVSSIAVSLVPGTERNFKTAAFYALKLAEAVLKNGLPPRTLLNINVPDISIEDVKGIKITKLGRRIYDRRIRVRQDPIGRNYYWILGDILDGHSEPGSDIEAVSSSYVSITPLLMDATDYSMIPDIESWFSV